MVSSNKWIRVLWYTCLYIFCNSWEAIIENKIWKWDLENGIINGESFASNLFINCNFLSIVTLICKNRFSFSVLVVFCLRFLKNSKIYKAENKSTLQTFHLQSLFYRNVLGHYVCFGSLWNILFRPAETVLLRKISSPGN